MVYNEDKLHSLPLQRGKLQHCFQVRGKEWENSKFCKIVEGKHGDIGV